MNSFQAKKKGCWNSDSPVVAKNSHLYIMCVYEYLLMALLMLGVALKCPITILQPFLKHYVFQDLD